MQGLGVRPASVVGHEGLDDVAVELVGEVEDVVVDAQLVGHAGAHRATSATEQQPGSDGASPELERHA